MFYKKEIIMLPTDNKEGALWWSGHKLYSNAPEDPSRGELYHLYILSNEEIKEDEWYVSNNVLFMADSIFDNGNNPNQNKNNKKVIASTDLECLPKIQKSFIEEYCILSNSNEAINEVRILYNEIGYNKIKINKEGCAILGPVKSIYTKKEVAQLIYDFSREKIAYQLWIKNNL